MSRPIYLVVYHSRLFAAHWALWVPTYENETVGDVGKVIHVEGNPREGFSHEFKRSYDMSRTLRSRSIILLSWVDGSNIVDTPGDGSFTTDTTAADVIEEWALHTAAPGPTLRSSDASVQSNHISMTVMIVLILVYRLGVKIKSRITELPNLAESLGRRANSEWGIVWGRSTGGRSSSKELT